MGLYQPEKMGYLWRSWLCMQNVRCREKRPLIQPEFKMLEGRSRPPGRCDHFIGKAAHTSAQHSGNERFAHVVLFVEEILGRDTMERLLMCAVIVIFSAAVYADGAPRYPTNEILYPLSSY